MYQQGGSSQEGSSKGIKVDVFIEGKGSLHASHERKEEKFEGTLWDTYTNLGRFVTGEVEMLIIWVKNGKGRAGREVQARRTPSLLVAAASKRHDAQPSRAHKGKKGVEWRLNRRGSPQTREQ